MCYHVNSIVGLRVEWCKARARALRWTEEVQLLVEEMRRVLQFFDWKVKFWEMRADFLQDDMDAAMSNTAKLVGSHRLLEQRIEGTRAYALSQARVQRDLSCKFKSLWCAVPALVTSRVGREGGVVVDLNAPMVKELTLAASFLDN